MFSSPVPMAARPTSFSEGQPPYVEGYARSSGRKVFGYVFLSTDIVDILAYFRQAGRDADRHGQGRQDRRVRILKHSEPILLLGIPRTENDFVNQYRGPADAQFEVGAGGEGAS